MPIITVVMFGGRTDDQKDSLAKAFTDTITDVCGIKPEGVQVIFEDLKPSDYATSGKLFSKSASATPAPTEKTG